MKTKMSKTNINLKLMNEIHFVNDFFWDGELLARGRVIGATKLFARQGDLDSACAVYSLMMMLMLHRRINRSEIDSRRAAQKITGGGYNVYMRLQDKIFGGLPGAYQEGYFFKDLANKLNECFKSKATASVKNAFDEKASSKKKQELVKSIMETIDAGHPVEIGITRKQGTGHAVVAIGYTFYYSDVRLFCLDPGYDLAQTAFWNTIIDISYSEPVKAIYSDKYFTPDGNLEKVIVDEILTIDEE